jgi:hypothetical protein
MSSLDLAQFLARNAKGTVYTMITDHMPKNDRRLDELVRRTNALVFGYPDLYSFMDIPAHLDRSHPMTKEESLRVVGDIETLVEDRQLKSPIFVTLGGDGVIAYDPVHGREGKVRVSIDPQKELEITEHRNLLGIGTSKMGDTFWAKIIYNVKNGMNMIEATKDATVFVIKRNFRYDAINSSHLNVDYFEMPTYDQHPSIVGDTQNPATYLEPKTIRKSENSQVKISPILEQRIGSPFSLVGQEFEAPAFALVNIS